MPVSYRAVVGNSCRVFHLFFRGLVKSSAMSDSVKPPNRVRLIRLEDVGQVKKKEEEVTKGVISSRDDKDKRIKAQGKKVGPAY